MTTRRGLTLAFLLYLLSFAARHALAATTVHDCRIGTLSISITNTANEYGPVAEFKAVYKAIGDGLPLSPKLCPNQIPPSWEFDDAAFQEFEDSEGYCAMLVVSDGVHWADIQATEPDGTGNGYKVFSYRRCYVAHGGAASPIPCPPELKPHVPHTPVKK
jgi:hypothetical protein